MLFSEGVTVRTAFSLVILIPLVACGGSTSPTGTGPTPVPGHPVRGFVFYDEDGDGALDPAETVRMPNVTVSVGGRTGPTDGDGRFTVSDVPAGAQSASASAASLPTYFTAESVSVAVPQDGADLAVPATLPVGSNRPNVYLAFGDSITVGVGAGSGAGYPDWLRADLRAYWGKADIINEGASATRSNDGESRLGSLLGRHRPAIALILYGTNDWNEPQCRNSFPCFTVDALRSMVLQTRDAGAHPVLGTIPPANPAYEDRQAAARNEWVVAMNDLVREMARQERVQLAEIHADLVAGPDLRSLFADHVHPNEEGYRIIARSWWNAITRPLAVAGSSRPRSVGFSLAPAGP